MTPSEIIRSRIADKTAIISVVGLGYVGLPLAATFAEAGFKVHGIDTDLSRVRSVNAGLSHVQDVPSDTIRKLASEGNLTATTNYDAVAESDAILICVPTPLSKTKEPDVSYIASAARQISPRLREGSLVALESTTYPGSTEDLLLPLLLENSPKNLEVGENLFLAFSPERVDPGRKDWTIANTPKALGGVTPTCTEVASRLYGAVIDEVVPVSSSSAAEMVKLLENTFRAANIALANEMAIMCERLGVNVWEVIDAAATKPFGFMPFYPGPGLGGHCIPIDPQYLVWKMRTLGYSPRFIQLADEINSAMPYRVVEKITHALGAESKPLNGSNILVLGVAYKPNVSDTRESPALDLIHLLNRMGAEVSYHDPLVPDISEAGLNMSSVGDEGGPPPQDALSESDCVVVVTNHDAYDWNAVIEHSRVIVDTRNATASMDAAGAKVFKL